MSEIRKNLGERKGVAGEARDHLGDSLGFCDIRLEPLSHLGDYIVRVSAEPNRLAGRSVRARSVDGECVEIIKWAENAPPLGVLLDISVGGVDFFDEQSLEVDERQPCDAPRITTCQCGGFAYAIIQHLLFACIRLGFACARSKNPLDQADPDGKNPNHTADRTEGRCSSSHGRDRLGDCTDVFDECADFGRKGYQAFTEAAEIAGEQTEILCEGGCGIFRLLDGPDHLYDLIVGCLPADRADRILIFEVGVSLFDLQPAISPNEHFVISQCSHHALPHEPQRLLVVAFAPVAHHRIII